jgi:hypothetical protein
MKYDLLCTDLNGRPIAFVAANIAAITVSTTESTDTNIWVVGVEDPFRCSEPYDILRARLENCLD